jgi:hypothetical protein
MPGNGGALILIHPVPGFRSIQMNLRTRIALPVASLALALLPSQVHAATITYNASGSGSDGPLSASATFTTSAGQLAITLSNTLALNSFISAGQTVSDLSFTLSNAPGTLSGTTATGQEGNISSAGVVTYVSGSPGRFVGSGGGSLTISGSNLTLEAIGGGPPSELIAPSMTNGGTYPSTNGGILSQNPYTIGPASFTLALAGVSSATTISNVSFSFGTGPDTFVPGTPGPPAVTPEPESLVLALSGALSVGAVQFGRRIRAVKN